MKKRDFTTNKTSEQLKLLSLVELSSGFAVMSNKRRITLQYRGKLLGVGENESLR